MTTCKEQCIKSRCVVQEKEKKQGKSWCDDDPSMDDCGKGVKIDAKQMKELRRIAVCMQKCLSKGDSGDCGSCDW